MPIMRMVEFRCIKCLNYQLCWIPHVESHNTTGCICCSIRPITWWLQWLAARKSGNTKQSNGRKHLTGKVSKLLFFQLIPERYRTVKVALYKIRILPMSRDWNGIKSSLNSIRNSLNTVSVHWYQQPQYLERGAEHFRFWRQWSAACSRSAAISLQPICHSLCMHCHLSLPRAWNLPLYESSGLPAVSHLKVKNCHWVQTDWRSVITH